MPPQPPNAKGRPIPLLLLCLGYLSIIPFGATFAICYLPGNASMSRASFGLLPLALFGLALVFGYSQATSGRQPWGAARTFWTLSTLFNIGIFLLLTLSVSPRNLWDTPYRIAVSGSQVFFPIFDPVKTLYHLSMFTGVTLVLMPLVTILSAVEARRAFRKTRPIPTAT